MRLPIVILLMPLVGLGACATVLDGPYQNIVVKTKSGDRDLAGAACTLTNDKGTWQTVAPSAITVRRSYDDLNVRCEYLGYVPNAGSAPSTPRSLLLGNIILGGLIGTGIDVGVGSAYDYPSPIIVNLQPAMAASLERFDRR